MSKPAKKAIPSGIMIVDTGSGLVYPLVDGFRVGRTEGDIVLGNDHSVSSRHCVFHVSGPAIEIEDLGSRNGTLVNDTRIESKMRVALLPGAKVRIGNTAFMIQNAGEKPKVRETEIELASLCSQLAPKSIAKPISWASAPKVNRAEMAQAKEASAKRRSSR